MILQPLVEVTRRSPCPHGPADGRLQFKASVCHRNSRQPGWQLLRVVQYHPSGGPLYSWITLPPSTTKDCPVT
jgi:hypothetical protein